MLLFVLGRGQSAKVYRRTAAEFVEKAMGPYELRANDPVFQHLAGGLSHRFLEAVGCVQMHSNRHAFGREDDLCARAPSASPWRKMGGMTSGRACWSLSRPSLRSSKSPTTTTRATLSATSSSSRLAATLLQRRGGGGGREGREGGLARGGGHGGEEGEEDVGAGCKAGKRAVPWIGLGVVVEGEAEEQAASPGQVLLELAQLR